MAGFLASEPRKSRRADLSWPLHCRCRACCRLPPAGEVRLSARRRTDLSGARTPSPLQSRGQCRVVGQRPPGQIQLDIRPRHPYAQPRARTRPSPARQPLFAPYPFREGVLSAMPQILTPCSVPAGRPTPAACRRQAVSSPHPAPRRMLVRRPARATSGTPWRLRGCRVWSDHLWRRRRLQRRAGQHRATNCAHGAQVIIHCRRAFHTRRSDQAGDQESRINSRGSGVTEPHPHRGRGCSASVGGRGFLALTPDDCFGRSPDRLRATPRSAAASYEALQAVA